MCYDALRVNVWSVLWILNEGPSYGICESYGIVWWMVLANVVTLLLWTILALPLLCIQSPPVWGDGRESLLPRRSPIVFNDSQLNWDPDQKYLKEIMWCWPNLQAAGSQQSIYLVPTFLSFFSKHTFVWEPNLADIVWALSGRCQKQTVLLFRRCLTVIITWLLTHFSVFKR